MSSLWASRLARPAFRTDSALAGGSLFPIDPLWGVVGNVPTRWKTTVSPLPTLVLLDLVTKPRDPLWPYLSSVRPGWARDCEFTSTERDSSSTWWRRAWVRICAPSTHCAVSAVSLHTDVATRRGETALNLPRGVVVFRDGRFKVLGSVPGMMWMMAMTLCAMTSLGQRSGPAQQAAGETAPSAP